MQDQGRSESAGVGFFVMHSRRQMQKKTEQKNNKKKKLDSQQRSMKALAYFEIFYCPLSLCVCVSARTMCV